MRRCMIPLLSATALACASPPYEAGAIQPATLTVKNQSWDRVTAYALCDDAPAVRVGVVEAQQEETFRVRACAGGSGAFGVRALAGGSRTSERVQYATGDRLVLEVYNTLPPALYVDGGGP